MLTDNKIKIIHKFVYIIISTLHNETFGDVSDRIAGDELKHSYSHGLRKKRKRKTHEKE